MFGSEVLEVVVGLIFLYLLFSLLSATVNELILTAFSSYRGRLLQKAIRTMLSDDFDPKKSLDKQPVPADHEQISAEAIIAGKDEPSIKDLGIAFYQHPIIYRFARKGTRGLPSYLSRNNFSQVVTDLLSEPHTSPQSMSIIKENVSHLPEGGTKVLLTTFVADAGDDIAKFKKQLEVWFDEMMQRTSGWYKRRVQKVLFVIGFIIAIVFNADTFEMTRYLSDNPNARLELVKMAENYQMQMNGKLAKTQQLSVASDDYVHQQCINSTGDEKGAWCKMDSLNREIRVLMQDQIKQATSVLGLGWGAPDIYIEKQQSYNIFLYIKGYAEWFWGQLSLKKILGWLITAIAVTLGGPFWFDLLTVIMRVRGTGNKPEETEKSILKLKVGSSKD